MSSTLRSDVRDPYDFYETPAWCVDRLLDVIGPALHGGTGAKWCDAGAGRGAIANAVNAWCARTGHEPITWALVERESKRRVDLTHVKGGTAYFGAFEHFTGPVEVVISNPPYADAMAFIAHAFTIAPTVIMLLRLNFLASAERAAFMRETNPNVYVLPNRPAFSLNKHGKRGTDSIEYAWFMWSGGHGSGRLFVLDTTPKAVRCAK